MSQLPFDIQDGPDQDRSNYLIEQWGMYVDMPDEFEEQFGELLSCVLGVWWRYTPYFRKRAMRFCVLGLLGDCKETEKSDMLRTLLLFLPEKEPSYILSERDPLDKMEDLDWFMAHIKRVINPNNNVEEAAGILRTLFTRTDVSDRIRCYMCWAIWEVMKSGSLKLINKIKNIIPSVVFDHMQLMAKFDYRPSVEMLQCFTKIIFFQGQDLPEDELFPVIYLVVHTMMDNDWDADKLVESLLPEKKKQRTVYLMAFQMSLMHILDDLPHERTFPTWKKCFDLTIRILTRLENTLEEARSIPKEFQRRHELITILGGIVREYLLRLRSMFCPTNSPITRRELTLTAFCVDPSDEMFALVQLEALRHYGESALAADTNDVAENEEPEDGVRFLPPEVYREIEELGEEWADDLTAILGQLRDWTLSWDDPWPALSGKCRRWMQKAGTRNEDVPLHNMEWDYSAPVRWVRDREFYQPGYIPDDILHDDTVEYETPANDFVQLYADCSVYTQTERWFTEGVTVDTELSEENALCNLLNYSSTKDIAKVKKNTKKQKKIRNKPKSKHTPVKLNPFKLNPVKLNPVKGTLFKETKNTLRGLDIKKYNLKKSALQTDTNRRSGRKCPGSKKTDLETTRKGSSGSFDDHYNGNIVHGDDKRSTTPGSKYTCEEPTATTSYDHTALTSPVFNVTRLSRKNRERSASQTGTNGCSGRKCPGSKNTDLGATHKGSSVSHNNHDSSKAVDDDDDKRSTTPGSKDTCEKPTATTSYDATALTSPVFNVTRFSRKNRERSASQTDTNGCSGRKKCPGSKNTDLGTTHKGSSVSHDNHDSSKAVDDDDDKRSTTPGSKDTCEAPTDTTSYDATALTSPVFNVTRFSRKNRERSASQTDTNGCSGRECPGSKNTDLGTTHKGSSVSHDNHDSSKAVDNDVDKRSTTPGSKYTCEEPTAPPSYDATTLTSPVFNVTRFSCKDRKMSASQTDTNGCSGSNKTDEETTRKGSSMSHNDHNSSKAVDDDDKRSSTPGSKYTCEESTAPPTYDATTLTSPVFNVPWFSCKNRIMSASQTDTNGCSGSKKTDQETTRKGSSMSHDDPYSSKAVDVDKRSTTPGSKYTCEEPTAPKSYDAAALTSPVFNVTRFSRKNPKRSASQSDTNVCSGNKKTDLETTRKGSSVSHDDHDSSKAVDDDDDKRSTTPGSKYTCEELTDTTSYDATALTSPVFNVTRFLRIKRKRSASQTDINGCSGRKCPGSKNIDMGTTRKGSSGSHDDHYHNNAVVDDDKRPTTPGSKYTFEGPTAATSYDATAPTSPVFNVTRFSRKKRKRSAIQIDTNGCSGRKKTDLETTRKGSSGGHDGRYKNNVVEIDDKRSTTPGSKYTCEGPTAATSYDATSPTSPVFNLTRFSREKRKRSAFQTDTNGCSGRKKTDLGTTRKGSSGSHDDHFKNNVVEIDYKWSTTPGSKHTCDEPTAPTSFGITAHKLPVCTVTTNLLISPYSAAGSNPVDGPSLADSLAADWDTNSQEDIPSEEVPFSNDYKRSTTPGSKHTCDEPTASTSYGATAHKLPVCTVTTNLLISPYSAAGSNPADGPSLADSLAADWDTNSEEDIPSEKVPFSIDHKRASQEEQFMKDWKSLLFLMQMWEPGDVFPEYRYQDYSEMQNVDLSPDSAILLINCPDRNRFLSLSSDSSDSDSSPTEPLTVAGNRKCTRNNDMENPRKHL